MIRALFRGCIVLLLLAVAGWYYWPQIDLRWGIPSQEEADDPRIPFSRVSLSYELSSQRWTEFPLLKVTKRIKAVTNAEIPIESARFLEGVYKYAVEYEVISTSGTVVTEGEYYFMSKVTPYRMKTGMESTSSFYYGKETLPTDGRVMYINLTGTEEAGLPAAVRFRLKSVEAPVAGVSVRVYQQEAYDELVSADLWNRLPDRVQEKLARGNVYSPELLSDQEKINLLKKEFRHLGPIGIDGINYQLRKMYILKEVEDSVPPDAVIPSGLYCAPNFKATIAIPEEGLDLSFVFSVLEGGAEKGNVYLRWFGRNIRERTVVAIPYADGEVSYQGHFSGGLVELTADSPMSVKLGAGARGLDVGRPLYTRVYSPENEPVRYAVNHQGGRNTPFRIDCRVVYPVGGAMPIPRVEAAFHDDQDRVVKRASFEIQGEPSLYDRVTSGEKEFHVTDPVSRYFMIPKNIVSVEISSNSPVMVSGFNRPPRMAKLTSIPEDYFRGTADILRQPTWFPVNPVNSRDLKIAGMSSLLQVQLRPPEDKADLLAGRYKWESFRPEGRWRGAYLLTDAASAELSRTEALSVSFHAIPKNRLQTLTFASPSWLRTVSPRLLYIRHSSRPQKVVLKVDGRAVYKAEIIGRQGELFLPPLWTGKHTVRLEATDGQFYMNSIANKPPKHLLRFAVALGTKPLSFEYMKESIGEENLSMVYYPLKAFGDRARLKVRLHGNLHRSFGPSESFTLDERVFSIRESQGKYLPLFHAPKSNAQPGETFFFPIGEDIKPGKFRVTVQLEKGSPGYLLFYRIIPGYHKQRRLQREILQ